MDNLLVKGATSNLLRNPNSLSNIKGRPEFRAPLKAVKTISPAPKNSHKNQLLVKNLQEL